jgi:GH24 family phage-related lysozyme (muramidase)
MSDFKIIGNPDPVVGKEEFYSVNTFLPSVLPFQNPASSNSFEQPVKWEIYILENGRWRKTKENDKTGKRISYTFLQKSLERKGIRILARRGEDVARLNVTTHPAEKPKIENVELLDKSGKKPTEPLSYGQTVKARVHCLHMEKHKVYVTLWEDDAPKGGHNKANEKNIIQTLSGVVKNGKADVDFLLRPSFAKIAKKDGAEDKIHEYYVTTDFNKEKIASNNVNVNDLEAPVAPFKGKVPVQQQAAAKPKASLPQPTQSKTKAPATGSSSAPKVKAEITRVHITDTAGRAISGVFKDKEIKVWIDSKGLIDKEIRLKLYDEDGISDDLLFDEKFTIKSNIYAVVVPLNQIPRSKGGGYWGEGAEQEVFAYVEVVQDTSMHKQSVVVDVDAKVFKPDPVEVTNKVAKTGEGDKNDGKNCGEKYCISKNSPASELIREINIRLAGFGGNVPTDKFTDRTEKMIKQFQRDYMKVPETGKVCGNVLRAIDEFCNKWQEKISNYTCLCKGVRSIENKCSGFGKGRYKGEYSSSRKIERYHKYERPGMHRSLLWGTSALRFYLSKQDVYKYLWQTAGYRCWDHNRSVPRQTTNHMGKAVDIQFSKNGTTIEGRRQSNLPILHEIYDKFYSKYLQAKYQWVGGQNNFSIEPIGIGDGLTNSWIHLDVREFDNEYLDDEYFIKTQERVINGSIVELAKKLGLLNTCMCNSTGNNSDKKAAVNATKGGRIDPKKLKASNKIKEFIKGWEDFKPHLYNDDSKDHHCTIGYGHLVHLGPCNGSEPQEFKNGITKERALELFDLRIVAFEKAVQRDVPVPLYQYEFDALVSFLFNCGENFFVKKKAPKLHKNLLDKEYEKAANEFLDVTSGGLGGLVKRRKAENNIFLNNIYDSKH